MKSSLENIALKCAIYFGRLGRDKLKLKDNLGRVILGSDDPFYKKPCFIYLYQTSCKEFLKFGISSDPEKRAKRCKKDEKDLYEKLLFSMKFENRMTACAIEQALIEHPRNLVFFRPHHIRIPKEIYEYEHEDKIHWDDIGPLGRPMSKARFNFYKSFGYERNIEEVKERFFNRRGLISNELTTMSKQEVEDFVLELLNAWNQMERIEYFNKYALDKMLDVNNHVKGLLNKTVIVTRDKWKDVDGTKKEGMGLLEKKNLDKFIPEIQDFESMRYPFPLERNQKYIPLKKAPKVYEEIYGYEMA